MLASSIGPGVSFAIVLCCLAALVQRRVGGRTIAACALVLVVATDGVGFAASRREGYRQTQTTPSARDLRFVREYFERWHPPGARPLTVYEGIWVWERVDFVWFELKARSYFSLAQVSGVLFSRETALETERRASIVRPFELERYKTAGTFLSWGDRLMITSVFKPTRNTASPVTEDLLRLCGPEEQIDVAILKQDFSGLAAASNGPVRIYECAQVRAVRHVQ
jgi:hypothetical protein